MVASGRPATPEQKATYRHLKLEGYTTSEAARRVGMSRDWAHKQNRLIGQAAPEALQAARHAAEVGGPIPYDRLGREARRAFDDFEYFGRRFFGRIYRPWQIETANLFVESLSTPDKEFVVENAPPGVGKTTLLHDFACWATVRDRRLRGCMGSRKELNGIRMLKRIRRSLERTVPMQARPDELEQGISVDAQSCMAWDYGLFRPEVSDTWRQGEFIVAQMDDLPIEEKEPTWSAYGMDSGVLSNRFNLIVWDDLVDKKTLTLDSLEDQRRWWDDEGETRLEPGGLLVLVGQRLGANDLYRYNLDKRIDLLDDDDEIVEVEALEDDPRPPRYRHVVFKAHSEENCRGRETHRRGSPAYPDGCLLDPHRLSWRELASIKTNSPNKFATVYQQEDADPESVLIPKVWVWGGTDLDGSECPGCVDVRRDVCDPLPDGMSGPFTSIATVDPSGTNMWAVQWWVTANAAGDVPIAFLMDLERRRMEANELLDWQATSRQWIGVMQDWQERSRMMGLPISHWIVEKNAAQRYLLVYDHVTRWKSKHSVNVIGHTTGPQHTNTIDSEMGPSILRDWFRHGRIVLPGSQRPGSMARVKSLKLIDELTRWPNASTDDQVKAAWFHFLHLPRIVKPSIEAPKMWRPSWMAS